MLFRELPQRLLDRGAARPAVDAVVAAQHALDVAVQDGEAHGRAPARGSRRRCCGRCRAARTSASKSRGSSPSCRSTQMLRRGMQVAGAGVVAEARPQREHVVERSAAARSGRSGSACDEALEVRDHGLHLRLLQHDFRQPDAIGRARMLPGQVVAAAGVEPARAGALRRNSSSCVGITRRSARCRRRRLRLRRPAIRRRRNTSDGVRSVPLSGGSGEPSGAAIHWRISGRRTNGLQRCRFARHGQRDRVAQVAACRGRRPRTGRLSSVGRQRLRQRRPGFGPVQRECHRSESIIRSARINRPLPVQDSAMAKPLRACSVRASIRRNAGVAGDEPPARFRACNFNGCGDCCSSPAGLSA